MKKTVLLGWELGAGFGHINPMIRVATALASDGHRIVFALRDVIGPWSAVKKTEWPVLIAPTYTCPAVADGRPTCTIADILGHHGYATTDTLAPLVRAWDGILAGTRPDLVIADYSPTLTLAAAGRVPVVGVGSGFTQPPNHLGEFPPLDPDYPPIFRQDRLLEVVRHVQAARGGPMSDSLPRSFPTAALCLTVFPELDPYRDHRRETVVGPLEDLPGRLSWPDRPRFFAYLVSGIASTEPGLLALAQAGFSGEAYIRGAEEGLKTRLRAAGLTVHDAPVPLAEALSRCRAVVHQGGLMTSMAALAAGRPQMLLPTHLEHMLNGINVHSLGAAHYLAAEYPVADLIEGVRQLLHEPKFRDRAIDLANHYHRVGLANGLAKSVEICRKHLN